MAAAALAGARKMANPTRHSRRFEARQMPSIASEKTCRSAKEDFFAGGKNKSGSAPATTASARPRPIQRGATRDETDMTASEPKAPAPRVATLVHPPTEPRRDSGTNSVVQPPAALENDTIDSSANNRKKVVSARW